MFSGTVSAGMSVGAQKFMGEIGNKMFKDFTKNELKEYIKIQTKYLKQSLEATNGAKEGKRQLQRELNKVVANWSDLKVSEIRAINVTTQKSAESAGEISVSIGATQLVKNQSDKDK